MTEQEAIKLLKKYLLCHGCKEPDDCPANCCDDCEYDYSKIGNFHEAIDIAIKALEKQICPINFINSCECMFEKDVLFNAIDLECRNRNCYRQDEYKIYLIDGYPCISIGHNKIRVHVLLGKLLYGNIRKGYVIHHKDGNKLNALSENLEYISSKAHTRIHMTGNDFRSEEGKWNGINAAKEKRYKKQITKEEIESMIKEGKTKVEIAKHFQCGVNTIYRRLGYKF